MIFSQKQHYVSFDYLIKDYVINLKEFTAGTKNYLGWILGTEFEIALHTDGVELSFDKFLTAF